MENIHEHQFSSQAADSEFDLGTDFYLAIQTHEYALI